MIYYAATRSQILSEVYPCPIFWTPRRGCAPVKDYCVMGKPAQIDIVRRAYELWEQAGKPEGRDQEFYHQAERGCRVPKSVAIPRRGIPTTFEGLSIPHRRTGATSPLCAARSCHSAAEKFTPVEDCRPIKIKTAAGKFALRPPEIQLAMKSACPVPLF